MSIPQPSGTFDSAGAGPDPAGGPQPNGHGTVPPGLASASGRPPGPSTRPALIVVGVTVVLFVVSVVAGGIVSERSGPGPTRPTVSTAHDAGLPAAPSRRLLGAIETPGEPPADLLAALAVPRGTTSVAASAVNHGVELYDRSLQLNVPASQTAAIRFFRAQLPFDHWHVVSAGPVSGGPDYRLLAQHPASDGQEWEVGVTVAPTTFPASSPPPSAAADGAPPAPPPPPSPSLSAGEATPVTLRLYVVSDQQ